MKKTLTTKLYYSISEVAKIAGVEQHVLRYWESEFTKLKPKKNRAGNRQYREKDIKVVRYIKQLLHHDMYTVQGAKKKLAESGYKEVEGQLDLLSAIPKDGKAEPKTIVEEKVSKPEPESKTAPEPALEQDKKAASEKCMKLVSEVKSELVEISNLLK